MEAASGKPLSPRALLELEEAQKPLFPLVDYAELPSISPETLKRILEDEIEFDAKTVLIVDCRHNFEYAGGHIKGALNIDVPEEIESFYAKNKETGKTVAIIFHCEFSSNRAPKLFRYLRNLDRKEHLKNYPELAFPYVYLLHGGYKAFFEQFPIIFLAFIVMSFDCILPFLRKSCFESFDQTELLLYWRVQFIEELWSCAAIVSSKAACEDERSEIFRTIARV